MCEMDDWNIFNTTASEQKRLCAALSGYFDTPDLSEEQRSAYAAYLQKRIRPAVETLIREDDFSKLKSILQTSWLSDADRKRFLNFAADQQKWEAFRILLNRNPQDPMQENTESRNTQALQLFEEARRTLCWRCPELGEALLAFRHRPSDTTETIESDGRTVYFQPDYVICRCAEDPSFLIRGYLQLLLQCIQRFGLEEVHTLENESLLLEPEDVPVIPWHLETAEPHRTDEFQRIWAKTAREIKELENLYGTGGPRRGQNRGGKKETLSEIEKRAYDYRRFLKQFTITREEMEQDLDSFDPVAYHYGLEHYGNLPFIEPLETREGNRLEELVIAIDTSGSCKKETVAKFLGETRSILEEKENFFSRWNICLIQCDSFVQDVTMIHSPKEWEAYREAVTIKGRGGTDFRPVFQKVEELREQHVFRNLKALIYFTDGDGIYPEQKPDYETAFVFVRQTEKMDLVPKWAKKLLAE